MSYVPHDVANARTVPFTEDGFVAEIGDKMGRKVFAEAIAANRRAGAWTWGCAWRGSLRGFDIIGTTVIIQGEPYDWTRRLCDKPLDPPVEKSEREWAEALARAQEKWGDRIHARLAVPHRR